MHKNWLYLCKKQHLLALRYINPQNSSFFTIGTSKYQFHIFLHPIARKTSMFERHLARIEVFFSVTVHVTMFWKTVTKIIFHSVIIFSSNRTVLPSLVSSRSHSLSVSHLTLTDCLRLMMWSVPTISHRNTEYVVPYLSNSKPQAHILPPFDVRGMTKERCESNFTKLKNDIIARSIGRLRRRRWWWGRCAYSSLYYQSGVRYGSLSYPNHPACKVRSVCVWGCISARIIWHRSFPFAPIEG